MKSSIDIIMSVYWDAEVSTKVSMHYPLPQSLSSMSELLSARLTELTSY